MKKALIISCTILFLIICILYSYDTYISNKDDTSVVPNKKVAAAVAKEIYSSMDKTKENENFILEDIHYDASNEAWVAIFWADPTKSGPVSTGKLYITIRKSDAQVLEVYQGERFYQIDLVQ